MIRSRLAVLAVAALATSASPARADLSSDADTLTARWRTEGTVSRLPVRFFAASPPSSLPLPPSVITASDAGCATVAVLGAMSTAFVLRLASDDESNGAGTAFPSVAGAAEVVRCGREREELSTLALEMRSPHGVLETVVATSTAPVADLRAILPHRDPGTAPAPQHGVHPQMPAPLDVRAERFERVLREEGATSVEQRGISAGPEGAGKVLMDLSAGCHRLGVLGGAEPGHPEFPHDIDAEIAWASGGIVASDRTDSSGASLLACTGERKPAILAFAGAPPDARIVLVHGTQELPSGIPDAFGEEARGRIAKAFVERRSHGPALPPVYTSLGIAGITELPIEVDPGQCYWVTVAPSEGDATLVALAADVGTTHVRAHTDESSSAVLASFCAETARHGNLEVEVHGTGVVWVAALFRAGARRLGEEAP